MITMIAHCGEAMEAPENTLESFKRAWSNGAAQGIEGDFHLTKDNVIVCMHDENTKRITGVDRRIAAITAAEFTSLDAGSWKGEVWKNVHPPRLVDVLKTIPPAGQIFLEVKIDSTDFSKYLEADRIAAGIRNEQITIISFHENTLRAIRKQLPKLRTLLLIAPKFDQATGKVSPSAAELAAKLHDLDVTGVDCVALNEIDAAYVKTVKDDGFEFHVWTVDNLEQGLRFAGYGVDSLTTNCPAALRRQWPD